MNAWSSLKLFCMVVWSDVCQLYAHTVLSNEFALSRLNLYLKSVKFLFFLSIYSLYMFVICTKYTNKIGLNQSKIYWIHRYTVIYNRYPNPKDSGCTATHCIITDIPIQRILDALLHIVS